jgi:hypothetical protein
MSLTPEPAPQPTPDDSPMGVSQTGGPRRSTRLLRVCLAIFTFEIGLFLTIFPWVDIWSLNYFSGWLPTLEHFWDDPYFRGAITGLGLVNIYLACAEVVRIFRR